MKSPTRIYYKEEQSMRSSPSIWALYVGFLATVGIMAFGLYQQLILDKPFGNHPTSNANLEIIFAVILVFFTAIIFFISRLKLITIIDEQGIKIGFFPHLMKVKSIAKEKISRYEVRKYRPFIEYGGWGLHSRGKGGPIRRRRWGIAYNVKGNMGLQLYLKYGAKILIGTQNPSGIERAMNKLMKEDGGKVNV
ncbi:MAG: hypothetical protein JXR65_11245 [Bacteroidales bacterium]|nr:hypothetical protein [Bacteroidales bacterium]